MYRMVHFVAMRRQELLDAVVADLEREGIGDRSLRDIAATVGTSHRMLIHHFGSRQGLLTEVVRKVESDQRLFLTSLDLDPDEAMVAMWQRLREPGLWPAERLFYECYARACRGEQPYASLLPGLVDDWLDRTVELGLTASVRPGDERDRARLGLAVFRGLLLDLVATGDRDGVDAAFEEFRALVERDAAAAAVVGQSLGPARDLSSVPGRSRTRPSG
jgi:AcrR family transcriptional regulator